VFGKQPPRAIISDIKIKIDGDLMRFSCKTKHKSWRGAVSWKEEKGMVVFAKGMHVASVAAIETDTVFVLMETFAIFFKTKADSDGDVPQTKDGGMRNKAHNETDA